MNEGKRTDRQLSTQRGTQLPAGAATRHRSPGRPRKISAKLAEKGLPVPKPQAMGRILATAVGAGVTRAGRRD
jgi:hypothetical protein